MHIGDYLMDCHKDDREFVTSEQCFDTLTDEQKDELRKSTTHLDFEKKEKIIKQGFVASQIMYIESGIARLDVTNDGKMSTVGLLNKGSFVGIVCSFACQNLDFSAVALEQTRVHIIKMEFFQKLIKENGEFALMIIRHMSGMTNRMVHWITRLSDKNVDGALSIMLLEFKRVYGSDNITLPVGRIELAEMCGFSKESLIQSLSRMHADGILNVKGKEVEILSVDRLQKIASFA